MNSDVHSLHAFSNAKHRWFCKEQQAAFSITVNLLFSFVRIHKHQFSYPQSDFESNHIEHERHIIVSKSAQESIPVQINKFQSPLQRNAPYVQNYFSHIQIPNRSAIDRHCNCKRYRNIPNYYPKVNKRSNVQTPHK